MQKLRDLYAETQNNAKNNFDKVSLDRCKKILAYANRQSQNANSQNDPNTILELTFYQQKFKLIIDKFNLAINEKTKKPKLQAEILTILSENFKGSGDKPSTPQPASFPASPSVPPKKIQQFIDQPKPRFSKEDEKLVKSSLDPKDMISSYFDNRKSQIQKSQMGFKSVLENAPKVSQKYAIKSNIIEKQANDESILKLNKQIEELSKDLQKQKVSSQFNQGLILIEKQKYESRIKDLLLQIQRLNHQNQRLKHQSELLINSRPASENLHVQPLQHVVIQQKLHESSIQGPYVIHYRSNDLCQLNKRYQGQLPNNVQKSSQFTSQLIKIPQPLSQKHQEQEFLLKIFPEQHLNQNTKDYEFQKSNVRLNKSEVQNQDRSIAIRSKLSFFKQSMVLYRGQQFELAIKSTDIVPLESRKITIYINNKEKFHRNLSISYSFDPNYYELTISKKLNEVQGLRQGKQQVEIKLKSQNDLDSLIQAKLEISNKILKFLIPTMMIQFLKGKPQNPKKVIYQKSVVFPLMFQFSHIYSAMEMIPLQKDYEEKLEVGTVYARSKHLQGYIYMRWKSKQQLQIQTIKPWILFLSYLMIKEY